MNIDELENGNVSTHPKVIYRPEYKENQLVKFRKFVENKYKIHLKDYWELHEWSYKNYPEFWDCVWLYFDISYFSPYKQVFDKKNGFLNAKWFDGLRFNYAANILKYRDTRAALIAIDDENNTQFVTYSELYDEVKVYIKALKDAGIQKGDVVACYLPNKLEPVFAFLATAAIGATWNGGLPLLGSKAVLSRFQQMNPKIMFTSGNFFYDNMEIRMDLKVPEVVAGLPSLEKVVFIPSKTKGKSEDISRMPKCVFLSEFLAVARSGLRNEDSGEIQFEPVPFEHPLCISFTSGTSGAPKGLVHSQGMFLASLRDFGLHQDCTREDTLLNCSPAGWITWHLFVNTLHLGLTLIMYEGNAFETSPTRYWDLVDKFGITSSLIRSKTVEHMEREQHVPSKNHSLKTLKQLFPMGSPAKPQSFNFLTEKVKKNIFCSPAYGCTEVFGLLSGLDSNLPVHRGEIQALGLGMDIKILDENEHPVIGKRGDLVLATPYPANPAYLLNDENQEMMKELYLLQHPGYWNVGDDAWINPTTKGLVVYGRSDETMNPKGTRFNCSDIYFALEGFPGVMDSVCVSQFNSRMDERVVLFVKMSPGSRLTVEVKEDIRKMIAHNLSIRHVPAVVLETPDIPYNLTGKKLNGLVKKLINKKPIPNVEVVVNPSSMEYFKTIDLGSF